MSHANICDPDIPNIGDEVCFWRDDKGWLGPGPATKVDSYGIEVMHNGRTKSSSFNRVSSLGNDKSTSEELLGPESIQSCEQSINHVNMQSPAMYFNFESDD